jgi:hypothetical protein
MGSLFGIVATAAAYYATLRCSVAVLGLPRRELALGGKQQDYQLHRTIAANGHL